MFLAQVQLLQHTVRLQVLIVHLKPNPYIVVHLRCLTLPFSRVRVGVVRYVAAFKQR
jgi:hypothetical protein